MTDWWFRQEYLFRFFTTADLTFINNLTMGALCDDVEPLIPIVKKGGTHSMN